MATMSVLSYFIGAPTEVDTAFTPHATSQTTPIRPSTPAITPQRTALSRTRTVDTDFECPPSPSKSVMFLEPDSAAYNNALSREDSFVSSNDGADSRKRRRSARPKTSYTICHPPPKSATRQKMSKKPLMQLHRLAVSARPTPAYDVLPSAVFSPALSRAIAKVPLVYRSRHADLAIVKADKYHQHDASSVEEDEPGDLLALISQGRKGDQLLAGRARILIQEEGEWEAQQLGNGAYEFKRVDEHGLSTTLRWVLKKKTTKDGRSTPDFEAPRLAERRFNFSTIAPGSRRHPVIASLTASSLDICDSYIIPSSSPEFAIDPELIMTTDSLRALIIATSVWVALREGWCPGYQYDDHVVRSASMRTLNRSKTNLSPPGSPLIRPAVADACPTQRSGSLRAVLRSASMLTRTNTRLSTQSAAHGGDGSYADSVMSDSSAPAKRRPRADTASTVLIHRSAGAQWRLGSFRSLTLTEGNELGTEKDGMAEDSDVEGKSAGTSRQTSGTQSLPQSVAQGPLTAENLTQQKLTHMRNLARDRGVCSTTSSSDLGARKLDARVQMQKRKKKSKGKSFFSRLFCGVIRVEHDD